MNKLIFAIFCASLTSSGCDTAPTEDYQESTVAANAPAACCPTACPTATPLAQEDGREVPIAPPAVNEHGNVALGPYVLVKRTTAYSDTGAGIGALANVTSSNNLVAIGAYSLGSLDTLVGGSESDVAVGSGSLGGLYLGSFNVGFGTQTLGSLYGSSHNAAFGDRAGYNGSVDLKNMTYCTFLGPDANSSVDGITNSTAVGGRAQVTKSDQMVLGNENVKETILRGNIVAADNSWGPEITVQCAVGVPCRCPAKTVRTGQLESITPTGTATTEMYCQSIGI
jgi:hypothetical protein